MASSTTFTSSCAARAHVLHRLVDARVDCLFGHAGERLRQLGAHPVELFIQLAQAREHGDVDQGGHGFAGFGDQHFPVPVLDLIEQFAEVLPDRHCSGFADHGCGLN